MVGDAPGALPHCLEVAALQIGRHRRIRLRPVAAAEGLPGEVVGLQVEAAGEPLQPVAQHGADTGIAIGGERLVLRRRNAEPVERSRLADQPAHELLLEDRGQMPIEQGPLLLHRPRLQHHPGVEAEPAGEEMSGADEAAEQAVAVEIAGEDLDPASAGEVASLPIGAADCVEPRRDQAVIGRYVVLRLRLPEEAAEDRVVVDLRQRRELEMAEGDMGAVEVDRADPRGIGCEIGQDVAGARGDRDEMVAGLQRQRLHVDDRVLPDLRIDQAGEGEREHPLQHAGARQRLTAMDGGGQPEVRRALHRADRLRHETPRFRPLRWRAD